MASALARRVPLTFQVYACFTCVARAAESPWSEAPG
jgi:hypothetical protein